LGPARPGGSGQAGNNERTRRDEAHESSVVGGEGMTALRFGRRRADQADEMHESYVIRPVDAILGVWQNRWSQLKR